MSTTKHYQINREAVNNALLDQDLKKWWVAEFSGVHRTTFRRWLNGETRFILKRNIESLARVLQMPVCEIAEPIGRKKCKNNKLNAVSSA